MEPGCVAAGWIVGACAAAGRGANQHASADISNPTTIERVATTF
jgi:hypothetical protein